MGHPVDPADPIFRLDNVVLTPHALCWSDELFAGCGRDAVQAVLEILEGKLPTHLINREVTGHKAWRRKFDLFRHESAGRLGDAVAGDRDSA